MSLRTWFPLALTSALALAALASRAAAEPEVRLDWNDIQCRTTPLDLSLSEPYEVVLGVFVLGQADPQTGYSVRLRIGPANPSAFPDAWRFDDTGCQSGRLFMNYNNPIPEACPYLFLGLSNIRATRSVSYDASISTEDLKFRLDYVGTSIAPSPTRRYNVVWFVFDHFNSVTGPSSPPTTCGGLEQAMCFQLSDAQWTDSAGTAHPWTIATPFASVNAAALGGAAVCTATPARAATWGAIKQQYR
jgi:hypothetical protein